MHDSIKNLWKAYEKYVSLCKCENLIYKKSKSQLFIKTRTIVVMKTIVIDNKNDFALLALCIRLVFNVFS